MGQVHERKKQWLLLLLTLLLQLSEGDHIHLGPSSSEATLGLRRDSRREALQVAQGYPGKDFASYAQERDAMVTVTITADAFIFVQCNYGGISHVLGNVTLRPAKAEEIIKWL